MKVSPVACLTGDEHEKEVSQEEEEEEEEDMAVYATCK